MTTPRNPLEPMSTTVRIVVTVVATLIVATLLAAPFVNITVLGIGGESVCATDQATKISTGQKPFTDDVQPAPGASVTLSAHPRYCTKDPSALQGLLSSAHQLAPLVYFFGALLLITRLIRGAERDGLYTAQTAGRLRTLGWWLLAGSVLAAIVGSVTETALAASLSRDSGVLAASGLWMWDLPLTAIFTGLGIFSFARIMRIGVSMREDLAGTV
ncbi:DUF2975 domain-containing protein [Streptomyces flavofungini]|uniref:DUF2975 domain-containing protein n=1 Tax=Streptomyces flavofungini TaxID=68200 RepID=UPI0025B091C1|nr:DUF2975 domain-containing protein [Streptomyces flavofungini]WJV48913.1 DUF2975 domain-containing protein [Streptomyces flavofungini]